MSDLRRSVGRPPGRELETVALRNRMRAMQQEGFRVAAIARVENISPAWAHKLLKEDDDTPGGGRAPSGIDPLQPQPRPQRRRPRLSESTMTYRAVLAMERDLRLRAFHPAKQLFWLRCVRAVYAMGDEDGLALGQDGDPFESNDEFATAVGGEPADLEHFLRRGLLKRLPDGIDLPVRLGLKPAERPAMVMDYAPDYEMADSTETRISVESDSTEITPNDSTEIPISVESAGLAHTATAAAYAKENQSLSSSSSTESRAGETPISVESDSTEIRVSVESGDSTEIHSTEIPPVAALAAELKALVRPGIPPTVAEVGAVRGWLDVGETPDTMRAVIQTKMANWGDGAPPISLAYFTLPLQDASDARERAKVARPTNGSRPPTAPPPTAAPEPEPEEDPAAFIGDDPGAQFARGRRRIMKRVGGGEYRAWLSSMKLISVADDEVTLGLPSPFLRDYVRQNFADNLLTAWQEENPRIRLLNIEVTPPAPAPA